MKKQIILAVAFLALSATSLFAAAGDPGQGVVGSVHDMTAVLGIVESQGRVCAFCHTPHHADISAVAEKAPLWSRAANGKTYVAYASSGFTVTNTKSATSTTDPAVGTTRLCLSCHDGSLAVDTHYGNTGGGSVTSTGDGFGGADIGAGQKLQNDHPVGMDFLAGQCDDSPYVNTDNTPGDTLLCGSWAYIRNLGPGAGDDLVYNGNAGITVRERLFDDGVGLYMTCATCHDVHNKKNKDASAAVNALVLAPQSGSALCVTCHIK